MEYFDSNGDSLITFDDEICLEEAELLIGECDFDNNGKVDMCELYKCA